MLLSLGPTQRRTILHHLCYARTRIREHGNLYLNVSFTKIRILRVEVNEPVAKIAGVHRISPADSAQPVIAVMAASLPADVAPEVWRNAKPEATSDMWAAG